MAHNIEPDSEGTRVHSLPPGVEHCDPVDLFGEWFEEATNRGVHMPEAMALATCTQDGKPAVRMVLLKHFDARGFVFYTNLSSRKSEELSQNPHAALLLHWASLERQVRIEGPVTTTSPQEAADYFATRPRGSQIGAWASKQSTVLDDRSVLEARVDELTRRFAGQEVALPPHWGGWRLDPSRIEFWQGQRSRLHDRLVYVRQGDGWKTFRLYP